MKSRPFLLFVLPSLIMMTVFIAGPLIGVVVQSFQRTQVVFETVEQERCVPLGGCTTEVVRIPKADEDGQPIRVTRWVGWENYRVLLDPESVSAAFSSAGRGFRDLMDIDFFGALRFTLTFTLVTLPLVLIVGLALALAVNSLQQRLRGPIIFTTLLPFIITPVIGALSIRWLFIGDGILTAALERLAGRDIAIFAQGWTIELLMLFFRVWHVAPFAFVIFYAGAADGPEREKIEAALVDGASRLQNLRYVIIPHLMPLIVFVIADPPDGLLPRLRRDHRLPGGGLPHFIAVVDLRLPEARRHRQPAHRPRLGVGDPDHGRHRGPADPAAAQHLERTASGVTGMENRLFRLPLNLRITTWAIVGIWILIAVFPLLWLLVMSLKLPLDAFDANPLVVILGPNTGSQVGGVSPVAIAFTLGFGYLFYLLFARRRSLLRSFGVTDPGTNPRATMGFITALIVAALAAFIVVVPLLAGLFRLVLAGVPVLEVLVEPILGLTTQHYRTVWVENGFYQQFLNTMIVTAGVVTLSLTIGTLAAYALARTRTSLAFWLLIVALVFRALPHSTLVAGYLPPFIELGLYGRRVAVIVVLVAINQPFTIWMLRSFFMNIPSALDEAALVDGCNRLQAFWRVIMPIMWPGVITTGLFSFMLAYNDFLVAALLLDGDRQTMVPAIMQYFNRETTLTDQLEAIAAAASITGPLFLLVLFFQRQIVSGLTQGAVKG